MLNLVLQLYFSYVQKITSAENLQSRASDEIVPFREFIIKDDTSALLWFVRFFNGSFRFIRSLIYCSDNGKSFLGGSCLSSAPRVLNRHERCSAPTSWDWTKHTMFNRVVLRTIWCEHALEPPPSQRMQIVSAFGNLHCRCSCHTCIKLSQTNSAVSWLVPNVR